MARDDHDGSSRCRRPGRSHVESAAGGSNRTREWEIGSELAASRSVRPPGGRRRRRDWRKRNPDYLIAWRLDQRAAQTPPPEPLCFPAPLNQLPWEFAKDQFGAQGADFIGVMSALILRTAKDQIRPYLIDRARLPSGLPPSPEKTSSGLPHTESRAGNDATGVSPTGPAMGTPASP